MAQHCCFLNVSRIVWPSSQELPWSGLYQGLLMMRPVLDVILGAVLASFGQFWLSLGGPGQVLTESVPMDCSLLDLY